MDSNKQKRARLQAKREKKRQQQAAERLEKLRAAGRLAAYDTVMPEGAIAADLTQQVPWGSYSAKPLYYEDRPFVCRDCGKQEVWTATQQKWWYEVAKGSLYTTAIRCRACRIARRANTTRSTPDPNLPPSSPTAQ